MYDLMRFRNGYDALKYRVFISECRFICSWFSSATICQHPINNFTNSVNMIQLSHDLFDCKKLDPLVHTLNMMPAL